MLSYEYSSCSSLRRCNSARLELLTLMSDQPTVGGGLQRKALPPLPSITIEHAGQHPDSGSDSGVDLTYDDVADAGGECLPFDRYANRFLHGKQQLTCISESWDPRSTNGAGTHSHFPRLTNATRDFRISNINRGMFATFSSHPAQPSTVRPPVDENQWPHARSHP